MKLNLFEKICKLKHQTNEEKNQQDVVQIIILDLEMFQIIRNTSNSQAVVCLWHLKIF